MKKILLSFLVTTIFFTFSNNQIYANSDSDLSDEQIVALALIAEKEDPYFYPREMFEQGWYESCYPGVSESMRDIPFYKIPIVERSSQLDMLNAPGDMRGFSLPSFGCRLTPEIFFNDTDILIRDSGSGVMLPTEYGDPNDTSSHLFKVEELYELHKDDPLFEKVTNMIVTDNSAGIAYFLSNENIAKIIALSYGKDTQEFNSFKIEEARLMNEFKDFSFSTNLRITASNESQQDVIAFELLRDGTIIVLDMDSVNHVRYSEDPSLAYEESKKAALETSQEFHLKDAENIDISDILPLIDSSNINDYINDTSIRLVGRELIELFFDSYFIELNNAYRTSDFSTISQYIDEDSSYYNHIQDSVTDDTRTSSLINDYEIVEIYSHSDSLTVIVHAALHTGTSSPLVYYHTYSIDNTGERLKILSYTRDVDPESFAMSFFRTFFSNLELAYETADFNYIASDLLENTEYYNSMKYNVENQLFNNFVVHNIIIEEVISHDANEVYIRVNTEREHDLSDGIVNLIGEYTVRVDGISNWKIVDYNSYAQ